MLKPNNCIQPLSSTNPNMSCWTYTHCHVILQRPGNKGKIIGTQIILWFSSHKVFFLKPMFASFQINLWWSCLTTSLKGICADKIDFSVFPSWHIFRVLSSGNWLSSSEAKSSTFLTMCCKCGGDRTARNRACPCIRPTDGEIILVLSTPLNRHVNLSLRWPSCSPDSS